MKSASKSCELDPIPTFLLKQSMDGVLPVITDIVCGYGRKDGKDVKNTEENSEKIGKIQKKGKLNSEMM